MWFFCVIDVVDVDNCVQDEFGYSYFQIELTEKEHEIKDRKNKIIPNRNLNLWKVGLALPCYWIDTVQPYYSFLTEDGYSLNSQLNWTVIT